MLTLLSNVGKKPRLAYLWAYGIKNATTVHKNGARSLMATLFVQYEFLSQCLLNKIYFSIEILSQLSYAWHEEAVVVYSSTWLMVFMESVIVLLSSFQS